ncbi:hypothetical protein MUK42_36786 [Musa troglodytarum]|uniref:Uncharacterized protein n=1 Tax=Musa troglodytarum TaxID=320322 RepID=A0A9E7FYU9_9LILI|nr:hypothetical protein MUK42_36786 [Musa troglodytarum]
MTGRGGQKQRVPRRRTPSGAGQRMQRGCRSSESLDAEQGEDAVGGKQDHDGSSLPEQIQSFSVHSAWPHSSDDQLPRGIHRQGASGLARIGRCRL